MIASPASSVVGELVDRRLGDLARRDHHPDRARRARASATNSSSESAPVGAFAGELRDGVGVDVVDDAVVPVAHQAADDVRAHPAESDHPELAAHRALPSARPRPLPARILRAGARAGSLPARARTATAPATEPADALVIFGISGDLARKMTFKSLYRLERRGRLDCPIVGVALDDWSDDDLRDHAREAVRDRLDDVDDDLLERFVARLSYVAGDYADADTFTRVGKAMGAKHPVFYLESRPRCSGRSFASLGEAGLTEGARVVIEKPFGHDLESARQLIGRPACAMCSLACAHRVLAEMEDRRRQHRGGVAVADALDQMIEIADAARGDHRHRHRVGHRARERDVEARTWCRRGPSR